MNKEEPHRNQAERSRKRIEKIHDETVDGLHSNELPPRSEVHHQKKKKTKWKLKYPVIRLLVLFFILLPIVSFSIYTISENGQRSSNEKVSNERKDYEVVDIEKNEKTIPEVVKEKTEEPLDTAETVSTVPTDVIETSEMIDTSPDPKDKTPVKKEETKKESRVSSEKIIYHVVKSDETLFRISMKYYHSQSGIQIIKNANGIQGNEIQVGQKLKIPLK